MLSRERLLDARYGRAECDVADRAIDVYVKRLREKLGAHSVHLATGILVDLPHFRLECVAALRHGPSFTVSKLEFSFEIGDDRIRLPYALALQLPELSSRSRFRLQR